MNEKQKQFRDIIFAVLIVVSLLANLFLYRQISSIQKNLEPYDGLENKKIGIVAATMDAYLGLLIKNGSLLTPEELNNKIKAQSQAVPQQPAQQQSIK